MSSHFKIHVGPIDLIFHPAAISSHLWDNPLRFDDDQAFLRRYLQEGDVCIDSGANVGLLTLTASRLVGKSGRVLAVEAHPQTHRYLTENVALNKAVNVETHHVALGAGTGTVFLSEENEDDRRHVLTVPAGVRVHAVELDDLIKHISEVHLLKLDVEGYEYEVLIGAARTLSITRCVYFESYDPQIRRYGHSSRDLFQLLIQAGFSIFFTPSNTGGLLRPIPKDHTSCAVENLLAVRDIDDFLKRTGYIADK